jgi:hypothetical protein
MNLFRQLLAMVCDNTQAHQRKVEKDLADTEFSVAMLSTKLGKRTESAGTDSVYSLIEDLGKDLAKLQQVVRQLASQEAESDCQAKIEMAIGSTVLRHLQPLVGLFRLASPSTPDSPGDLLEQHLQRLLETHQMAAAHQGATTQVWGNLHSPMRQMGWIRESGGWKPKA